tara:strand:+ start:237 stop:764 length:528 start_codon:yes stop_codon:yes gene_type:complete
MPFNADGSRKTALYKKSSGFKMKEFSGFGNSPLTHHQRNEEGDVIYHSDSEGKKKTEKTKKTIKSTVLSAGRSILESVVGGSLYAGYKALTRPKKTKVTSPTPPKSSKLKETPGYADVTPFKPISLPTTTTKAKRVKTKRKKKHIPVSLKPIKEKIKTTKITPPKSSGGVLYTRK